MAILSESHFGRGYQRELTGRCSLCLRRTRGQAAANEMARVAERLAGRDLGPAERAGLEARLAECGECVLALVRAGYPADAADYGGCTVLHALCWGPTAGHVGVLAGLLQLLDAGAPGGPAPWPAERVRALVEAGDEGGHTCLHVVARSGGPSREAATALLLARVSAGFAAAFDPALKRRPPPPAGGYLQRRGPHNRIPPEQRCGAARARAWYRMRALERLPRCPRPAGRRPAGGIRGCGGVRLAPSPSDTAVYRRTGR